MLKLKISGIEPESCRKSIDLSRLWATRYFEIRLVPSIGRTFDRIIIFIALVAVPLFLLYLWTKWLLADCSETIAIYENIIWIAVAATACWFFAICVLWHNRFSELMRARLYCLKPGQLFPLLPLLPPGLGFNRVDIVARTSEPNVTARLDRAFKRAPITLLAGEETNSVLELRKIGHLCKTCECLPLSGRRLLPILTDGKDFWPIARLVISRLLYTPVLPMPQGVETVGAHSYQIVPLQKGRHLWFAFVTHRAYVAGWLLMLAVIMLCVACARTAFDIKPGANDAIQLPLVLSTLPLFWWLWASRGHRNVMNQWANWANRWRGPALGNLPLFLAGASIREGWEELSDDTTQVDLGDFGVDSQKMLDMAGTIFLIFALIILQLIK